MSNINFKDIKIGFIGSGNMGGAIIKGVISNSLFEATNVLVSDPNDANRNALISETGCVGVSSNIDLLNQSNVVVVAVKPNVLPYVLEEIKVHVDQQLIISIVAGVSIERYKNVLGDSAKIVRTLPNTPLLVNEGMTIISYDGNIVDEDKQIVEKIFSCVGEIEIFSEKLMNEVIALTSSSPAYIFQMIEAMADGAVLSGIPRNTAYKLAAQSIMGSAKLVLETGKHPAELKDMVCSPGGTTIEAVAELENKGFRSAIISAMKACTDKAYKL